MMRLLLLAVSASESVRGPEAVVVVVGVLVLVLGDATSHTDVFISAYGYYWTYYHIV